MWYFIVTMKIFSWNVNGIRAIERKGAWVNILAEDPDVICLQEIKAEKEQLSPDLATPDGYEGFFHSSRERKGYAGTAIYTKWAPEEVIYGLPEADDLDRHGRTLTVVFDGLAVVTAYFPNGKSKTANLDYKRAYYKAFLQHITKLHALHERVIVCGDLNVAHTELDLERSKENANTIGFLPEERAWIDGYLAQGWIDVWRTNNPDVTSVYTYWDQKTGARDRNVGWRIDYFLVSPETLSRVTHIEPLTDFMGSDHCPVVLELADE